MYRQKPPRSPFSDESRREPWGSPRGSLGRRGSLYHQLVASRHEHASLTVTSNQEFGRWGEVFGDDLLAAAMIDRLVHHAFVVALKGDSYRLKTAAPSARPMAGEASAPPA